MLLRLLTAVGLLITFVLGGCADPGQDVCGGEGDNLCLGDFSEFLREAHFDSSVEIGEKDSFLALTLFEDERHKLAAEIIFDGGVEIWGLVEVIDFGEEEYEVDGLKLRRKTIKGKFNIPDFPLNAHFKGTYQDNYNTLALEVDRLGSISLLRVDDLEEIIREH